MNSRGDVLCTSVFTVGEALRGPIKHGAAKAVEQAKEVLRSRVELLPFNLATAERFAEIRAANRVSSADAIHLATAAEAGVDLFLTNDHRLSQLVAPGIDFIAGMDVNIF